MSDHPSSRSYPASRGSDHAIFIAHDDHVVRRERKYIRMSVDAPRCLSFFFDIPSWLRFLGRVIAHRRPRRADVRCSLEAATMKLQNQIAIVTGAGRNIGEKISKALAGEGAKVAVVDIDKGRGDKVAAAIVQAGGEAMPWTADVSLESDIAALVKAVMAKWGKIDILIN